MIICNELTYYLLRQYGDRKKIGRFSILTDPSKETIYIVPKTIEHIDYVKEILKREDLISLYPFPLVPSHLHFKVEDNLEKITGVITGNSGLEQILGKIHNRYTLNKTHKIVWNLIANGEIPLEIKEDKIIYNYTK